MKFNHKIPIDMFDFLKTGKFDYIEIGQTQEWILNNFLNPDFQSIQGQLLEGCDIWMYGKFEFHFFEGKLITIWSDHFQNDYKGKTFNAGKAIKIKPWIFKKPKKLTLCYVMQKLTKHGIDFEKQTTEHSLFLKLQSGVKLYFENIDGNKIDPNEFLMMAFSFAGKPE